MGRPVRAQSKITRDYIASLKGQIAVEYLPGYAPELNPVEYIWAYWKQHELPNVCPRDWRELDARSRDALRRMRRRPRLITAFWVKPICLSISAILCECQ